MVVKTKANFAAKDSPAEYVRSKTSAMKTPKTKSFSVSAHLLLIVCLGFQFPLTLIPVDTALAAPEKMDTVTSPSPPKRNVSSSTTTMKSKTPNTKTKGAGGGSNTNGSKPRRTPTAPKPFNLSSSNRKARAPLGAHKIPTRFSPKTAKPFNLSSSNRKEITPAGVHKNKIPTSSATHHFYPISSPTPQPKQEQQEEVTQSPSLLTPSPKKIDFMSTPKSTLTSATLSGSPPGEIKAEDGSSDENKVGDLGGMEQDTQNLTGKEEINANKDETKEAAFSSGKGTAPESSTHQSLDDKLQYLQNLHSTPPALKATVSNDLDNAPSADSSLSSVTDESGQDKKEPGVTDTSDDGSEGSVLPPKTAPPPTTENATASEAKAKKNTIRTALAPSIAAGGTPTKIARDGSLPKESPKSSTPSPLGQLKAFEEDLLDSVHELENIADRLSPTIELEKQRNDRCEQEKQLTEIKQSIQANSIKTSSLSEELRNQEEKTKERISELQEQYQKHINEMERKVHRSVEEISKLKSKIQTVATTVTKKQQEQQPKATALKSNPEIVPVDHAGVSISGLLGNLLYCLLVKLPFALVVKLPFDIAATSLKWLLSLTLLGLICSYHSPQMSMLPDLDLNTPGVM